MKIYKTETLNYIGERCIGLGENRNFGEQQPLITQTIMIDIRAYDDQFKLMQSLSEQLLEANTKIKLLNEIVSRKVGI